MVNLVIDYMQLQMITCKFNDFIAHNSDFLSILRIHFIQLLTRTLCSEAVPGPAQFTPLYPHPHLKMKLCLECKTCK